MKNRTYKGTRYACYTGSFVQAINNNLAPILFIVFQEQFGLTYSKISWLVLFNFVTQFTVDVLCVKWVDKIGYRRALVFAHIMSTIGFILLAFLPRMLDNAFVGLAIPTFVYAIGGGLLEVLVSPVVDSLPSKEKAAAMSLLHSFYCWGQVCVVIITTLLVKLFTPTFWYFIPLLWAIIPLYNAFNFAAVPFMPPISDEKKPSIKDLFSSKIFLVATILMLCAGASELTMSQWSSLFAEKSLGVSKVTGDLLGPCMFAALMGIGRTIYGIYGEKIKMLPALKLSAVLCVVSYLMTAIIKSPIVSLIGCALCGLSVSLMWPGIFSLCSKRFKHGSTSMFAILAVAGDVGCSLGPWLAGQMSTVAGKMPTIINEFGKHGIDSDSTVLRMGILAGTVFPLIMFVAIMFFKDKKKKVVN